jgi:hypothetical protein
VTFNINLSGQFLRAVANKMRAVAKNNADARKNQFFRAVGVESILRWNSTLKPCRQNRYLTPFDVSDDDESGAPPSPRYPLWKQSHIIFFQLFLFHDMM